MWPEIAQAGAQALPAIANLASLPMQVGEARQARREEMRRYAAEQARQKMLDDQSKRAQDFEQTLAMMKAGQSDQDSMNGYGRLMALRQYGGR